jgi:hypothetical protein
MAHITIHPGVMIAIKQIFSFQIRMVHILSFGPGMLGWTAAHVQAKMMVRQFHMRYHSVLVLGDSGVTSVWILLGILPRGAATL